MVYDNDAGPHCASAAVTHTELMLKLPDARFKPTPTWCRRRLGGSIDRLEQQRATTALIKATQKESQASRRWC